MENQPDHGHDKRDDAIIFCSDPRVRLWKWIKRKLLVPNRTYVPIGVLGGAVPLAFPDEQSMRTGFNYLCGQVRFAIKEFGISRIVIIGHDCGIYKTIPLHATIETKKDDLARIVEMAKTRFLGCDVVAHYGHKSGNEIEFEFIREEVSLPT